MFLHVLAWFLKLREETSLQAVERQWLKQTPKARAVTCLINNPGKN